MRAAEAEATPLVERAAQLDALDASLAEVAGRSRGSVVLVRGEAGIGKTALLRAFAARVRPPARLLWAACDPLFTPRPLGPLLDIASTLGGEVGEQIERGARPHDVAAALGRELAARAPTVLVLEDLQWADEATLDVVRLLARRADGLTALIVPSFRDELVHATHPLAIVLGELTGVRRLALEPLSRAAVEELARASPLDAAELYERTGGNPFFVTEALAAETERVPATVRDAVLARAARLSPPARALLDAVAIVPQTTELWLLEALAGSLDALDEGLAAGMLAGDAHGVAFRHELARLAVEGSLAPHRAVALHRAAAAALSSPAAGPADPVRLAHHAEAAADPEGVLRWAPEAAARAAAPTSAT